MRSYIFTSRERKLVEGFLKGDVTVSNPGFSQLVHRVRRFTKLPKDIMLYNELCRRLAESKTA